MNRDERKRLLVLLVTVLILLVGYRLFTAEPPKTAALTYSRGAKAAAPVRGGMKSGAPGTNPAQRFLQTRREGFPGTVRDIFRFENPAPKPRPVIVSQPVATVPAEPEPPPIPEKTSEEIAAEAARADLSRFRFLGYLTEQDQSLFLSRNGEVFIVKSGDRIMKNYQIKSAGRDYVVLYDTITNVEVRIELSGSGPDSGLR